MISWNDNLKAQVISGLLRGQHTNVQALDGQYILDMVRFLDSLFERKRDDKGRFIKKEVRAE